MEQKLPFIKGRKPVVDPKTLYKVLTYAYLNGIYTTHKIETAYYREDNKLYPDIYFMMYKI
jgi:transposase